MLVELSRFQNLLVCCPLLDIQDYLVHRYADSTLRFKWMVEMKENGILLVKNSITINY